MIQRYFITLCVLAGALLPLYTFAQAKSATPQGDKNTARMEAQAHKNRLDRAGNAINAAEANVLSLEKHIQKLGDRVATLEKAGADLTQAHQHMTTAQQHIAAAKQQIGSMKTSLVTLDTKNHEHITALRSSIKETQTRVHAAKEATRDIFAAIRALKIQRQAPIITPPTESTKQK
jgi:chromosome segregation ATPase